jgi:membrane fusion protein, copper/silver efflux system
MTRRPTDRAAAEPAPAARGGTRRAPVVLSVLVLALLAALLFAVFGRPGARREANRAPAAPAARGGVQGMAGMEGMTMPGDGSVRLSAAQLRQFGVTFGTAEQRTLTNEVRTVGTVTADETRIASVTSRVDGYVERLHVNATGQPVRRGQAMAAVYSPELLAAQQELLVARRLDRTAGEGAVPGVPAVTGDLTGAARQRLRLLGVSDAQIDAVLRTGQPERTVTLHAPSGGVVTEKHVVQGQAVRAGMALFTLTDLSVVWVDVQLRAADAGLVREGATADLEFAGLPGRPYKGRVAYVYPTVGEQTRTLSARVVVGNADGRLKPGMYATARLSGPARAALTVPRTAVVQTGDRAIVFVDLGGGRLQPRDVEIGRVAGDYAEVLTGLEPGQRVVTSAQYLLESESNLGEVMKSMIGTGGSAGGMESMPGMPEMDMKGADTRGMPGAATPPARPR